MGTLNAINQSVGRHDTVQLSFLEGSTTGTEVTQDRIDVALMAFRIVVCVIGMIGNGLVIFVITVLREYKKAVTHWYVLQLAIADSLFLLTLPFKVIEQAHDQWIFSAGMCKGKEAILFLNYYSSVVFLMVMSVDRYIALCHAFSTRLQKLRTKFSAYTITVVVWIVCLCLCTPVIMESDKSGVDPTCKCQYEFPKPAETPEEKCRNFGLPDGDALEACMNNLNTSRCRSEDSISLDSIGNYDTLNIFSGNSSGSGEDGSSSMSEYGQDSMDGWGGIQYDVGCSYIRNSAAWTGFILFNFIAMFVVPLLIMSACYLLIAIRLQKTQKRRSSVTNEGTSSSSATGSGKSERKRFKSAASAKAERNRIRVTFVCLILVILFLVCWLPFHSVHLAKIKGITGTEKFCAQLSAASSVIAYLNSALNPYVYNFVGTKFFKRLRSAARTVRASVLKRTVSDGGITVRYKPRKHSLGTSTNSEKVKPNLPRQTLTTILIPKVKTSNLKRLILAQRPTSPSKRLSVSSFLYTFTSSYVVPQDLNSLSHFPTLCFSPPWILI